MLKKICVATLALAALLAAGCSKPPTVNANMTKVMAPNTQTIWDISSRAFNAKGDGLDETKISAADWAKLEDAGVQLRNRALILAKAKHVKSAARGETILGEDAVGAPSPIGHDWDAASAKRVQDMIDANPALFSQRAMILADAADTVVQASRAKDAEAIYQVSANMDEVCDGCHMKFWGTDEPPPFPHDIAPASKAKKH